MAYEDDEDVGATSQFNFGLGQDPLYNARVMPAPEASVPAIQTQGMQPQKIMQPQPINVPDIPSKGGGASPNELQPSQAPDDTSGLNMNSLQGLLQMKGLESMMTPAVAAPSLGAVYDAGTAKPGAGAGPGRGTSGKYSSTNAGEYQSMVNAAADKYGIDRRMLTSQLFHESAYDSNAVSPAGAKGLGQFMDATAKEMGVDVKDPKSSIDGAARYFAKMRKDFNENDQLAYAAYNWGPGNVDSWLRTGKGMKGQPMPDETRNYVATITGRPLAPNVASAGNVPSASAAPMAAMIASNDGSFKPPPSGTAPKAGDMSPHGGPYIQRPEGIYATDRDGYVVGPVVKSITAPKFNKDKTEDKQPTTKVVVSPTKSIGPVGNDQGTPNLGGGVSQPMRDPDKIVPGATPSDGAGPKPEQDQPQQQAPASGANFNFNQNSDQMQKLWKYMLIKSLFPQLKFRNIGYDPWAVHKFGQGGGY